MSAKHFGAAVPLLWTPRLASLQTDALWSLCLARLCPWIGTRTSAMPDKSSALGRTQAAGSYRVSCRSPWLWPTTLWALCSALMAWLSSTLPPAWWLCRGLLSRGPSCLSMGVPKGSIYRLPPRCWRNEVIFPFLCEDTF